MYIKNQYVSLTYRLIFLGLCAYGIMRHLSVSDSIRNINMLSYFTIQSNILCFFVALASVVHNFIEIRKDEIVPYTRAMLFFRGMSILVITITFFTYSIVLTKVGFSMNANSSPMMTINDLFVHYMIPILAWVDFILFQPKPSFKRKDPIKWLIAPLIYFVFILIKGRYMDGGTTLVGLKRYPYYFLDAEKYGYAFVFKYAMVFLVVCVVMGYAIWSLDFIFGMIYTKLICPLWKKFHKQSKVEERT